MPILAYSGGLDTSFCVPYLRETSGEPVVTVIVNTGGHTPGELAEIEQRAYALGAEQHVAVDARRALYDDLLSYLIKGNVLRGGVYPLCVGPERVVQAREVVRVAHERGAKAVAHGSTGAGNDQVRFDVALRLLGPELEILAPIRSLGLTREASAKYLRERGHDVSAEKAAYSINRGLWGTTVGGRETLGTSAYLPEEAWPDTASPADAPGEPLEITLHFERGLPVGLEAAGESESDPVALIERLAELGAAHGVGRGIHVGDTILGIKGRVGFEAPAALTLIAAHRELEKLVLTRHQLVLKQQLGDFYGQLVHEAQYFDPVLRDVEALFDRSQEVVSGAVRVRLHKGQIIVAGATSPHSLFDAGVATYGETNALWDGRDAEGFTRFASIQALLARSARGGK
jgi:argininosuccinate synthase